MFFYFFTRGWVCGFSWGKSLLNEEYFSWYIFNIELKKSSGVLTGPLLNIFMKTSIPSEWDTPWNVGKKSHPSRTKAFNIDLAKVEIIDSSFKSFWHQKPFQVFSCPPCLFLKFRTRWTFLMELEMVSDGREHSSEVSVKVSSRSDIRNHVKTPPVLQVFSWSLGGHWYSWWTWIWCQMGANIHQKLLWKFHQDPTCFGWFRDDLELQVGWGGVVASART